MTLTYLHSSLDEPPEESDAKADLAHDIVSLINSDLHARANPDRSTSRKSKSKKSPPKARALQELRCPLPRRSDGQPYSVFAAVVLEWCKSIRKTELVDTVRFLAACIHLASPRLPAIRIDTATSQPDQSTKQERQRWRQRANITNRIVNGLIPTCDWKAFLLFDLLAGRNRRHCLAE